MSENERIVKTGDRLPLKNVAGFMTLVKKLQERPPRTSNIGVMYGRSGEGKTEASIYASNKTRAVRVEVGDSWGKKRLVTSILHECGATAARGTVDALIDQAVAYLGDQPSRPLIIDEADKLVDRKLIETLRDLADKSQVPVLLVGEEALPVKLATVERVGNRVLDWYGAVPCDLPDCRLLARMALGDVAIADDLLETVRLRGDGRARRIVTTLYGMAEWARNAGVRSLDSANYTGGVFTGEAPKPRNFKLGRVA